MARTMQTAKRPYGGIFPGPSRSQRPPKPPMDERQRRALEKKRKAHRATQRNGAIALCLASGSPVAPEGGGARGALTRYNLPEGAKTLLDEGALTMGQWAAKFDRALKATLADLPRFARLPDDALALILNDVLAFPNGAPRPRKRVRRAPP